jgi:hypothetical protein
VAAVVISRKLRTPDTVPLTYEIDERAGLITLTLSGEIVAADIAGYVAASRRDPRFRPGLNRLVVSDGVTGFPNLAGVREITRRTGTTPAEPPHRIAAVATGPLDRGMIAMFFGRWGLGDRYELFESVAKAREWLGL